MKAPWKHGIFSHRIAVLFCSLSRIWCTQATPYSLYFFNFIGLGALPSSTVVHDQGGRVKKVQSRTIQRDRERSSNFLRGNKLKASSVRPEPLFPASLPNSTPFRDATRRTRLLLRSLGKLKKKSEKKENRRRVRPESYSRHGRCINRYRSS